ncbi:MAG: hypothetical protein ACM3XS_10025 [Bacteroidota bacterium]
MGGWILTYFAVAAVSIAAYALTWRRRRDVAAYVYVHKGAIWWIWLVSWAFGLAYLACRAPLAVFFGEVSHPVDLAKAMLALLGILLAVYLAYLLVVYPLFASLRPAFSRESFGLDWQLDIYVEDKVTLLVEGLPTTPLLLLNMGLTEVLQETPAAEQTVVLRNLWHHYVPVVTDHRARGLAYLPDGEPDFVEPELNSTVRLALETLKIADNQADEERRYNVAAFPLAAGGKVLAVFVAYWPRRRPFKPLFNLLAQQFCTMRVQYMLAAEVPPERMTQYDNPWNDGDEG